MEILAELDGITVARATPEHLPAIERLLADDPTSPQHVATTTLVGDDLLGDQPIGCDPQEMFRVIDADPNQILVVALEDGERVVATLQMTLLPTIARGGCYRAFVTGARVRSGADSVSIGKRLFTWAKDYARERGARVLLVMTSRDRAHVQGFYTTMGFQASHEGLTLQLVKPKAAPVD